MHSAIARRPMPGGVRADERVSEFESPLTVDASTANGESALMTPTRAYVGSEEAAARVPLQSAPATAGPYEMGSDSVASRRLSIATLTIVDAVVGHDAPLRSSCAVPQSVAFTEKPRAGQRLDSDGVKTDNMDPSEDTQFTLQETPPSVTVVVSGNRVPQPATRRKCVTPKTATDREGAVPRLRADAMSEAIVSTAGGQRGRWGELHWTVVELV